MVTLRRFQVSLPLPDALQGLVPVAHNLWWSWNARAKALFRSIDAELFARVNENPLALFGRVDQNRRDALANDPAFLSELAAVRSDLDTYMTRTSWFDREHAQKGTSLAHATIAYFSMEFGIHECLPVYSGGLGVLAGDHLKTASDLGLPLVGVGIAFSEGYFHQSLDADGWQRELYPPNDWHDLPVSPVLDAADKRARVKVTLPVLPDATKTRDVVLEAWRVQVGRISLYLLDANLEENDPADRALTNTLYGGDRNHRIRQEILLGVGGFRMLGAIGISPTVCHLNEGHSAFLALERVRELMAKETASFEVAALAAAAGTVFTTHTPVPAGNDAFPNDLLAPYLPVLSTGLEKKPEEVMGLGRVEPLRAGTEFSMPVLAIRLADHYNGVSALHGREARAMWRVLWPTLNEHEIPIGSITNGVHASTWIAPELAAVYDEHLGAGWRDRPEDPAAWAAIERTPDEVIWSAHERARERLHAYVARRLDRQTVRKGAGAVAPAGLSSSHALTIGFARRFATYKRGTLLLRDLARLERIVSRTDRPVQLLFAGKAHPQDWGGKELIRDLLRTSRTDAFRGKIVFVEDYDMGVARQLVAGVDVWLNTPRRPLEASGTSGMKAALNGVLNASILDGWWCEGFTGDNGFSIGTGEEYADAEHGDRLEALDLYRLLEEDLIPMFYDRDASGLPRRWIHRMKRSIATVGPAFNTARMVEDYVRDYYVPAAARFGAMTHDHLAGARALDAWQKKVAAAWPSVAIAAVKDSGEGKLTAGQRLDVNVEVQLGTLAPADVTVDVYFGHLAGQHALGKGEAVTLRCMGELGGGRYRFEGAIPALRAGEHAYAVRVLPRHDALASRFATRLIAWH
jgi:starch phosphorylase